MPSNSNPASLNGVKGWVFDVYPSASGEVAVWIITENGKRIRLTDKFEPKVYVSGKTGELQWLASHFLRNNNVKSWSFAFKYVHPADAEKTRVLEVTLKDCRKTGAFVHDVLVLGDYLRYAIYNCDLRGDRGYLFEKDIFPLASVAVEKTHDSLRFSLFDSANNVDYAVPSMRIMKLSVELAKKGKIESFDDPIQKISVVQDSEQLVIDTGGEADKILRLVQAVKQLDPDLVLTVGGDSFVFPYLIKRAALSGVLDEFVLSRDNVGFLVKLPSGRTFVSYGYTHYRATMTRLFGRVHIDVSNSFAFSECSLDGMFEVARLCRIPLHAASRSSIGSSMSSLQFYEAMKNDILLPRNKSIPEEFKSAYELLVGDRGGFVYEPRVGLHDGIGAVDFSSMYPSLMVKNNISVETVLCKCCPDSRLRIPELNYNVCERREGIIPRALRPVIAKRLKYKRLKVESADAKLREVYDRRQAALKWILVTCFGYLGYRNAKFGSVDGHIGVCAFGREAFLKAARMAEERGFEVIHGIVDSLWLKKHGSSVEDFDALCKDVSAEIKVPLNFDGRYKWIVFLPSKIHSRVGVLNRYYGVTDDGKVKVRGIEVRRRDTPRFVFDAQMEMINVLAKAGNAREFMEHVPEALSVVKDYRQRLLDGEVPLWNLIVTKHLSKQPGNYKQHVSQVIAAEQLLAEGATVHAGNNIRFLFTDAENKRYSRRVRAEDLIEKGVNADVKKYLFLLYDSAAGLLNFAGFTRKSVHDWIAGNQQRKLM